MSHPQTILLEDTPTPSPSLLALLQAHLPHSITVLRHLQFARNFPGGHTPSTHILYARHAEEDNNNPPPITTTTAPFAVAFVDLSRAPETQLSLYSSLERAANEATTTTTTEPEPNYYTWTTRPPQDETSLDLVLTLLRRIRALATTTTTTEAENPDPAPENLTPLIGSLHETVRQGLLARGVRMAKSAAVPPGRAWEFCGKWLFRVEALLGGGEEEEGGGGGVVLLPEGAGWDRMRWGDAEVVQGRTSVRRLPETLLKLPSTVVRLEDGTPIAWAFMGLDGTLMTLHVEVSADNNNYVVGQRR
ncbi:hypothetical protein F5144DRAFT_598146 [Chaetomium tenue]|uniref:Uncharacterized protein n=1 Tax=Chaetomium tenue TaxID=1854479 RepID=A0ACB7PSS4_9PEZI|nr:hypothetical protein F5144DRAFT_598146 [Chaetomium globosum]